MTRNEVMGTSGERATANIGLSKKTTGGWSEIRKVIDGRGIESGATAIDTNQMTRQSTVVGPSIITAVTGTIDRTARGEANETRHMLLLTEVRDLRVMTLMRIILCRD